MLQANNNIKAYQILHDHILALESNMEVLQLLSEVPNPVGKHCVIRLDDEDFPLSKQFKQNLGCE
jgi:hypothetical protein